MTTNAYERVVEVTPALGPLRLVATEDALIGVYFVDHARPREHHAVPLESGERHAVIDRATRELAEYARGDRAEFSVPLAPRGTEFQRAVWRALLAIPFGETRSYEAQANMIGNRKAVRAVGMANALNPISIVIPCHRVIGKGGSLTGYAGGMARKEWLLAHEAARASSALRRREAPIEPSKGLVSAADR